jgi:hypothetical protein
VPFSKSEGIGILGIKLNGSRGLGNNNCGSGSIENIILSSCEKILGKA